MICDPALRIIIGADFFRPVTTAHQLAADIGFFLLLLCLSLIKQLCLQQRLARALFLC